MYVRQAIKLRVLLLLLLLLLLIIEYFSISIFIHKIIYNSLKAKERKNSRIM